MGPYLLILCHSGPIPPNLLTQLASPSPSILQKLCSLSSSLTYTMGPYLLILCNSGPIPPFTYTGCTTKAVYCTQTAQLHFLPYLHSGSIPPHFLTQWAYTPHFLTQWAKGNEAGQCVYSRFRGWCPLCKKKKV